MEYCRTGRAAEQGFIAQLTGSGRAAQASSPLPDVVHSLQEFQRLEQGFRLF